MNFWDRVDILISNKGITRKQLASEAQFNVSDIGKGKSNSLDSSPSADKAVRIAKVLGTTVEYLVTGKSSSQEDTNSTNLDDLYRYEKTIRNLSSIPEQQRKPIESMIAELSSIYVIKS